MKVSRRLRRLNQDFSVKGKEGKGYSGQEKWHKERADGGCGRYIRNNTQTSCLSKHSGRKSSLGSLGQIYGLKKGFCHIKCEKLLPIFELSHLLFQGLNEKKNEDIRDGWRRG